MRKISEKSKLDILALLILIFMTFLEISDKVTMKKIIISCIVFFILFLYTTIKALKNNTFFEKINEDYPFTEAQLDLIGIKLSEKIETDNKLFNSKLDKLLFYYEDSSINNLIIDELIKISTFNKIIKNNGNSRYISFLSNNLLFLIYLKEQDFSQASLYLTKVKENLFGKHYEYVKEKSEYVEPKDVLHQTINNKFILFYLLEYKSDEIVSNIINELLKLDKNVGKVYVNSLELSKDDTDYLLKIIPSSPNPH